MAACRGNNSQNCIPGTFVEIVEKGPRYSLPASGFGSYVSRCEQPPGCQTMITAFFSRLDEPVSPARNVFCACKRRMPGRLNVAKPASPACKKPRRLFVQMLPGPGQTRFVLTVCSVLI